MTFHYYKDTDSLYICSALAVGALFVISPRPAPFLACERRRPFSVDDG